MDGVTGEVNLRISYRDLKELLTASALHCYESLDKRKKRKPRSRSQADQLAEANAYDNGLLHTVRCLERLLDRSLRHAAPEVDLLVDKPSVAERRSIVEAEKADRLWFDRMIEQHLSELRAGRAPEPVPDGGGHDGEH